MMDYCGIPIVLDPSLPADAFMLRATRAVPGGTETQTVAVLGTRFLYRRESPNEFLQYGGKIGDDH